MIDLVEFENFKVLRQAKLPLGPLSIIVGPNGSGKSTALEGLRAVSRAMREYPKLGIETATSVSASGNSTIAIRVDLDAAHHDEQVSVTYAPTTGPALTDRGTAASAKARTYLASLRHFALDPRAVATPVALRPVMELETDGMNLSGVLDRLRDQHPERFEAMNSELGRWLPEFDRVLFDTPSDGRRAFLLRVRENKKSIPASSLSEGTLLAVALLTLAYLPDPPTILTIEEPDRGIHPRLLRDVQDALYRLAFPENFGESRRPVQVIATTHSPYFLDLFRDHPEQVVIAQKNGLEATFERLSDREDIEEILGSAPLGEAWYSGILGGVPAGT